MCVFPATQEPANLMVEAVTGIRKLPAYHFQSVQQRLAAAGMSYMPPDVYVEVQRGGKLCFVYYVLYVIYV